MLLEKLSSKKLIHPPPWLLPNTHYLVYMGSTAYGTNSPESDYDVYGWTIPPKEDVFPHLRGEINGFGNQIKRFDVWQEQHIQYTNKEYDFQVYSIVRYFHLVMQNNPNMLDSLFVPADCLIKCTRLAQMVRDRRKIFLSKKAYHTTKGYAYSQLSKMSGRDVTGKRKEMVERWGFDLKFAAHTIRLLYECEMVLAEGDLDLRRNNEHLKAIRRGEISEDEIRKWTSSKEKYLEKLYETSTLQYSPPQDEIKALLLECLEEHYGSLDKCIENPNKYKELIQQIKSLIEKV